MRKLVLVGLLLVSCSTEKKVVNVVSGPVCQVQSQWDGSSLLVCGDGSSYALSSAVAAGCSVYEDPTDKDSRIIECPDGSRTKVHNGIKGQDGVNGTNGQDGANGADGKDGDDGKPGENGKDGDNGKDGKPGENGKDGDNGKDGVSCNAKAVSGGVEIQCGTNPPVLVKNGIDGKGCTVNPSPDGAIIRCGNGLPVTIKNGKNAALCAIGLGERGVHIRCGEDPEVILIQQSETLTNCSAAATDRGTEMICGTRRSIIQNGFDGPGCWQSYDNTEEIWRCSPGSHVELIVDL